MVDNQIMGVQTLYQKSENCSSQNYDIFNNIIMFSSPKKVLYSELVTQLRLPNSTKQQSQHPKQQSQHQKLQHSAQRKKQAQSQIYQQRTTQPLKQFTNNQYNNQINIVSQLQKARKLTTYVQRQVYIILQQFMNKIQTKVYDIEVGQRENVALQHIYKNSLSNNQYVDNQIKKVVNKVSKNVASDINQQIKPQRRIPKTKDDIKQLQQADRYRFIKIKNGQIKNKIVDLRSQLQRQYFQKKAKIRMPQHFQYINNSDYYSMSSPKTLQANQFIHRIQQQRKYQREKYGEYLEKRKSYLKLKQQEQQQRKTQEMQQRRRRLQQIIMQKQMKRQQQYQEQMKRKEQHKQWANIYAKEVPLHKKMQNKYMQTIMRPVLQERMNRLEQIKEQRRPIDIQQINEHDQKYIQYKKDNDIRVQAQKDMERQRMISNQQALAQLYKGKYRYLALQEMMNQKNKFIEDPRYFQRQKKARQIVYGDEIKDRLHEEIKLKLLQEPGLQQKKFVKRKRNADGTAISLGLNEVESRMSSFTDPKVDGKKNLHFMKQLVRKKGIQKDRPIIRLVQQKHIYPDYLEEIKRKRKKSLQFPSQLDSDQINFSYGSPKIDQLLAKQKNLNQKVKRGQVRRKYNSLDYKQDAHQEQNQINALRLKMKLINQLN